MSLFPVAEVPNLSLIAKRGFRTKSYPRVGGGRNTMFSVDPQAYFNTRSSRSLEAGTWLWFSTPLFPAPILKRWPPIGRASSRPTSVCSLNRAGQGCGEHPNSGVGSVLQPSSRGLEAWALPVHIPQAKSLTTSPARTRRRSWPAE